MSILGPVTDVDRSVWQRRAVKVLGEILDAAYRRELPALYWSLATTGTLMGSCTGSDMPVRRAAFIAWADFLGIDDWNAWDSDGVTHMSGHVSRAVTGKADAPHCKVMITAAVDSPAVVQAGV